MITVKPKLGALRNRLADMNIHYKKHGGTQDIIARQITVVQRLMLAKRRLSKEELRVCNDLWKWCREYDLYPLIAMNELPDVYTMNFK